MIPREPTQLMNWLGERDGRMEGSAGGSSLMWKPGLRVFPS